MRSASLSLYAFVGAVRLSRIRLGSPTLQAQLTLLAQWANNADQPVALDYNQEVKSAGYVSSLYAPDAYRSADHNSVLVALCVLALSSYLPLITR